MGVIFAIEKDGVVYLAADAVKECCDVNFYVNQPNNLRLHKMPSGIIVAASGPMYITQHLWLNEEWFELKEGETFDKKFIVTQIVSRFYEAIKDIADWKVESKLYHKSTEVQFIIAKGADIFIIWDDLSVIKCDRIAAISDKDSDVMMLSYANACKEENPELLIKKTYEFVAQRYVESYTHGFIINTRDFILKKMEDVQ